MLDSIDPDSTKGKLFLLVADKLFIGIILAIAFVAYDYWKTIELREHNQIIQKTQNDFKRAEFTKELLPLVLDTENSINIRIEVLSSLIRTRSIEAHSAVSIALSILHEGTLTRPRIQILPMQQIDSYVRMLAPIIPEVLPQIIDAYGYYGVKEGASTGPEGYSSALIGVFEFAWKNFSDEDLNVLNDMKFVADNLSTISAMTPDRHKQYESWRDTSLLALQILRDIEIVGNAQSDRAYVTAADTRLKELVEYTGADPDRIRLSAGVLEISHLDGAVRPAIIEAAFNIIMQHDDKARTHMEERKAQFSVRERHPFISQFVAAKRYLVSAAMFNRTAEQLATPVVRDFLKFLQSTDVASIDYPALRKSQRTAVCVLVASMVGARPENPHSKEAEQLVRKLSELPEDKLTAANLKFLIDRFDYPVSQWSEERECGLILYE